MFDAISNILSIFIFPFLVKGEEILWKVFFNKEKWHSIAKTFYVCKWDSDGFAGTCYLNFNGFSFYGSVSSGALFTRWIWINPLWHI